MKVILITDVRNLGRKNDVKIVSEGYAINFLIPKKLVIVATKEAMRRHEIERIKAEDERKIHEEILVKNIKELEGVTLTIAGKTNDKGHLFAGIHKEQIARELEKQTRLQVHPSFIELEHPIKEAGEHIIVVNGGGKTAKFKIVVPN